MEGELEQSEREAALGDLRECMRVAERTGAFPRKNDEAEALPTGELALALAPAYAGLFVGAEEPQRGQRDLREFLARAKALGLPGAGEVEEEGQEEAGRSGDLREARTRKISRFKRKKELKQRCTALRQALRQDDTGFHLPDEGRHPDDGERARLLVLAEAERAVLLALEEVEQLSLQATMERMRAAGCQPPRPSSRPGSTFTITPEDVAKMSLDPARPEISLDSPGANDEQGPDHEGDAEARRQREWDDFKDANPRGSGNTQLRPCA